MSTGLSAPVAQPNSLSSFLNDLNELAALKQQETQLATQLAASNPRDVLGTDTITFPNGLKRPATDAELMAAAKTFSDMPNAAMEGMSAATDVLGNVPFMRDVVNTPVSMAAYVAARRIQNGPDDPLVKLTAPGMTKGRAFATIENARRQIESSEGGVQRFYASLGLPQPVANFVSGVHQQGVGNVEFLPVVLSSGLVAKGLAQGARKAGQKAVADLLEMEAKEAFQQGAGTLVKQQAAQMGAAAVNAAVNPLAAPKEIVQRITPRGLEQTPTGEFVPTGGESLGQAVPKAIVSQTIEMQTEGLGEIMGPALGAALKRSGLSAKAVAAVPEFVKRWASRAGVKTADDLARGMKSSIPGFHGVPQQLIEERINEVWQFAAGTQEDAGLTGKVVQGDLLGAAQQFGQEVAAFGIMGGINRGLNKTGRQEAISDRVEPTALADWVRSNLQRAAFINEFPNSPSRQQWASIVETLPELAELDVRSSRDRTEFMQSFRQAYDIAAAQLEATAREQGRQLDDEWDAEERARGAQSLAAASQTPPTLVAQPPVPGGKNMGVKASVATPRDVTYEQGIVPPAWPEQVQQPQPQEQSDEAQQVQGQPQGRSEGQVAEPPQQQPQQPVAEQQPAVATQQMPPDIADAFEQAWSARDDFAMHSVLNNKAARQEFEKRTGVKVELQPGARAGSIARGFTAVSQQSVAEQQPPVSSQTPDLSDLEPDEQVKVRDRMSKGASLSKAKEDVKHMRASSVPWSMEVMDKLAGMGMPKAMQTEFVMKAQKGVQEWGTDWKQKRDALEAEYIAKIPQGQQPTFVNDVANEAQRAIMRLEDAGASDDVMKEFASRATQITATSKQDAKEKVAALEAEFTPQPDRPKIGQAGVTKAVEEPPAQSAPPKKVGLRGQTAIPGMEREAEEAERVEVESRTRVKAVRALRDSYGPDFADKANQSLKAFEKAITDDRAVTEVSQAMDLLEDIDESWDASRESHDAYRDAAREVAQDVIDRATPDTTAAVTAKLPKSLESDEPFFALRDAMKDVIADLVPPDVFKTASADIRNAGDTAEDIVGAAIDAVKYEGYRQKGAVEALTAFVPVAQKMLDDANAVIARKDEAEAEREREQAEADQRAERLRQEKQRADQEQSKRQQPPPAPEPEQQEATANPWVGAPVEQESRWFGTRVRVAPGQRRYVGSYEGTVQRVMNGGTVVEVKPDGTDSTFREKTELVTIIDLKDNGAAVSANVAPDAIRLSKTGEVQTPGLLPELARHLADRLRSWWGKGFSSSYATLIDSQRAVVDAVEAKAKEAPQLPEVDVEAEDAAFREATKAENEASSKYWNVHTRYEQFVTQKKQTIAANLGVPKQSKAAKWANAWAHAERQARELPEAKSLAEQDAAAEKVRNDAKAKLDEARRARERAEAKKQRDAMGEVPEGTVLISGGNSSLAIQVGKYDPETGLYKAQSGATDSKGVFYKDGSSPRDFSPRMLSGYVTVEQDATLTALREQAVQVQNDLKAFQQDKSAKEEKEKRRKQVEAESDNVAANFDGLTISVARAMPDRLQPEDDNVLTNGKWLAKADALPAPTVNKIKARKAAIASRGPGFPKKATTDKLWKSMVADVTEEPTFLGVWKRTDEYGSLALFRKADGSVIAFDANIVGYLTKEGDVDSFRVGRTGNNPVDHAVAYRGKKPVALVMGMENANADLLDWDRVQARIGTSQDSMPIGFVGKNRGVKKPREPKGGGPQVLGLTGTPRSTRAMGAEVTESEKKDKKEPKTPIGAFQRLESPETRPTTPTPRPVDIVESMRKLFGDPIDIGRLRMRGSLGEFDVRTEAIALRKGYEGAILVAGHETAHRVDKQQNVVAGSVPNEVRRALVKVDYAPTTHAIAIANGADKYLSQREGFAEYVRHRLQGTTRGPALQKLVADGEVTDAYAEALGVIDNWFETEWLPQHPDIAKRLATLVDATQQYIQAGPQGRIEAGTRNERGITAAQVSRREYPDVALSQVGDAVTRFRRDWVNRWEFLDAYEKDIVRRGGKLPENNMSSYQFARSLSNVPSLTASFVEDGVRSWDGKTLYHPGLVAAIRDSGLNDEEVREWEAYHIARRVMAIHKEKPEYRSSADIRDMEAMVQQITDDPSKAERYEKMTKAYSAFNNAVLDWAVDMKLVDSAAAEKMKKSYDGVYMYMSREQTKRGKPSSISPGAGIGILPLHNPFRRLKQGSQMPFYRPIEAALLKTSETISNAFQHQIVRQMWNAQRKVEGMGAWITPVANANKATRFKLDDVLAQLVDAKVISKEDADTIRAVDNVKRGELTDKTLKTIADALGVDAEQFEDDVEGYQSAVAKAAEEAGIADAAAVMTIWKPSFELSRKEGVFSFKDDNGQMVTVRVHPEILNTLLMSRGLGTLNAVGKLIATLGGMISRGAVKYNLAFPLPNLDRDYLTSQAQSNEQGIGESLVRPFATASSMLVDALKSHGIVAGERDIMNELFHKKGAAEWYALDTSPVGLHDLRRHVLTSAGVTQPFVLQDSLRGGLKKITDILTVGEALIRQGEFVAALHNAGYYVVNNRWHTLDEAGNFVPMKEGQQPPEYVIAKAALAARDVTVDFQTVGALVARMPKVFGPFFAAKVQSLDRMYQQIKRALAHPDKAVRDKAMKRLLAYAAMQSALAALIWYFTHDKDWYKAGRESYAIYRNFMPTSTMRIPKGYEWSIFANITEAALNVAFDKEPENTKKAVERFLNEKSVLGELAYATAESMSPVSLPPKVPIVEDMPLVSTMYQLGVNRDWRGKPIVSKDLEGLESAEQYRDTTPGVYRAIGKATGTSPVKIEYATDSLSGGMTRQVTRAGTKLMEGDVGGAATQAVLGGFMLPRDSSRATNDYFEALAKADKRVQTAERRGKPDPEAKDALDMLNAYSDVLKAIRKTAREAATEDEKTALWHMEIGTARDAIGKQPLARYKSAMSPDAHLPPKIKEARDEELLKQMRKIAANKPVSVTERERKQGLTLAEKQAEWARDKKVAAQILKGAGWSWSKLAPVWTAGTDRTDTEGTKRARIRVAVDLGSQ